MSLLENILSSTLYWVSIKKEVHNILYLFYGGSPIMKTLTNSIIGPGKGNPKQATCRMNIQEFFFTPLYQYVFVSVVALV